MEVAGAKERRVHLGALPDAISAGLGCQDLLNNLAVFRFDRTDLAEPSCFKFNRPFMEAQKVAQFRAIFRTTLIKSAYSKLLPESWALPWLNGVAPMEFNTINDTFSNIAYLPVFIPYAAIKRRNWTSGLFLKGPHIT